MLLGFTTSGGSIIVGSVAGWEITDEQRIAARTSPDRDRDSGENYKENIDGRRNPELFFSYELLDHLLWGISSDTTHRLNAHALFDAKITAYGYDVKAFWRELDRIARPYIATREMHRQQQHNSTILTSSSGEQIVVFVDREVCVARFEALQKARQTFGEQAFDRFLYSAVAPEISHSEGGNAPDRAEQLRYVARGCK